MCLPEEDEERRSLIPKTEKNKQSPIADSFLRRICRAQSKDLLIKLDMASMQSPRTQCCCCAIGVFAAMFGIFMLSAGICIVLNVNYMEVDTSGLPPDLHNEDGKRIVGIILICVAICTLGLSATVSIIYFALCNRSGRGSRHAAVTSSSTTSGGASHAPNHSNGNVQSSTSLSSANNHHQYPNNKHVSKVAAMHGVKVSGGGGSGGARGTPPGSQTSLNAQSAAKQRRQMAASSSGVPLPVPSHSNSPSAGTKRGRRNMKKNAKTHHQRLRNRSFLPTHTEEDAEAAKSVVDLKSQQAAGPSAENSSNSGSSMAPSQISSTMADNQYYSTTSFINAANAGPEGGNNKASPVIIINEPTTPIDSSSNPPVFAPSSDSESLPSNNVTNGNNANESAVVYNENEITRTTEKVSDFSSSSSSASTSKPIPIPSSSSSSTHSSLPNVSVINSGSGKDSSYTYSNPAFQHDSAPVATTLQTTVSLDHDASEFTTDDSTSSPVSDRFSPPLGHQQPPISSSSHLKNPNLPNVINTSGPTNVLQYPGNGNTYPTPLISAGLDLADDLAEREEQQRDITSATENRPDSHHHILQVQPHLQQASSSSSISDNAATNTSMQSDTAGLSSVSGEAASRDVISDLPQSSRHNDRYKTNSSRGQHTVNISNNNIDNLESRSESRSSFNSTLSTDGEDKDDMVKMQEKMKELLK